MIDVEVGKQFFVVVHDAEVAVAAAVSDGRHVAAVAKDDFLLSSVWKI